MKDKLIPWHFHHRYDKDPQLTSSTPEFPESLRDRIHGLVAEWWTEEQNTKKDTKALSEEQIRALANRLKQRLFSQYSFPTDLKKYPKVLYAIFTSVEVIVGRNLEFGEEEELEKMLSEIIN